MRKTTYSFGQASMMLPARRCFNSSKALARSFTRGRGGIPALSATSRPLALEQHAVDGKQDAVSKPQHPRETVKHVGEPREAQAPELREETVICIWHRALGFSTWFQAPSVCLRLCGWSVMLHAQLALPSALRQGMLTQVAQKTAQAARDTSVASIRLPR